MLPVSGSHHVLGWLLLTLGCAGVVGCGGGAQAPATAETKQSVEPAKLTALNDPALLPVNAVVPDDDDEAAEDAEDDAMAAELEVKEPEKGSPEWLIREILAIKVQPLPEIKEVTEDEAGQATLKAAMEQQKQVRRQRNEQIIQLAEEAIGRTSSDAEKQQVYKAAVHHLVDTRLQLAKQGSGEDVKALEMLAENFYKNAPESEAAAQSAFALLTLSHHFALQNGVQEPAWLMTFSRQAQTYATRFPKDQARAVPYLISAAKSCDMNGLMEEARSCYGLLKLRFNTFPEVEQLAGVFRRLDAVGQPAQVAGPTPEGNFIKIEDYKGKTVLVVFWASHVPQFAEDLATLEKIMAPFRKFGYLDVVGVNLDETEGTLDKFLEEHNLNWPQIFHTERDKRGWNTPVVQFYGINRLPTMWLIDPNGNVADTGVTIENCEKKIKEVAGKFRNATKSAVQPASARSDDTPARN